MSTIRDFYEGDIRPNEVNFKNKKYSSAFTQREHIMERLNKSLSKKQLKLLAQLDSCYFNMEFEYGREMFTEGFSLGTKLTAESFCTKTH